MDGEERNELLPEEHTILERPVMKFRPFGKDEQGKKIADVSGTLVVSAIQGMQVLKAMQESRFAGVLLDIGLPQLDGLEVLRQVRRWNQQIPIVVVTAAQSKDLAVHAISLGAQAYVLKPFDSSELHHAVQSWFTNPSV